MNDKELKEVASKILKVKKGKSEPKKDQPKNAGEWLRKAYIDHDPADGAPKVGDIGYV